MNVYFIDPSYVKPEAWKPMLEYLKVKYVYSFIPREQLSPILYSLVKHSITGMYSNQNIENFSNICVYWLRAYFETNIRLVNTDYPDLKLLTNDVLMKYGSQSPYNNIRHLDSINCLILLNLTSDYGEDGSILPPVCCINEFQDRNLPSHIASYCLNILRKKYKHNLYTIQTAFVLFDKYFKRTYRYVHKTYNWDRYTICFKDKKKFELTSAITRAVHKASPDAFPPICKDEKRFFSPIITEDGQNEYRIFIEKAKKAAEYYSSWNDDGSWQGESWQEELADMVRGFWQECGEAGSNCESWPGWE